MHTLILTAFFNDDKFRKRENALFRNLPYFWLHKWQKIMFNCNNKAAIPKPTCAGMGLFIICTLL
ncbi:hypothetical protein AC781_02895 [Akkermansia glycaniphila]|nr:hypothetical protein AC781_02895 [Akkermansia glycaniphila]